MKRGIMALLVLLAVLGLSVSAEASGGTGSVEVRLDAGELPVTNGAVTLYPVGIPTEGGYRLLDSYGGGVVRSEDLGSGNLAMWLSELSDGGRELYLDVDGRAVFSHVEEGLYLMKQTQRMDGFWPFRAFLVQAEGHGKLRYEPVIQPIMEEPPCTGDVTIYLALLGMALSGGGLVCCGAFGKKEKKHRACRADAAGRQIVIWRSKPSPLGKVPPQGAEEGGTAFHAQQRFGEKVFSSSDLA